MELENKGIDICAIAETKKKGKGSTRYGNYIFIYSGREKNERATSGVGILMNGKVENNISGINYVNDRLLQLTVKLQKSKTSHIISVYAPDINKPRVEIDTFYQNLQRTLDGIPKQDEVIILGDLNARIGNETIVGIKNRFNEETINDS
uniref:Endonuclease/exonuclease/phosphatase domain-containing protein n=1 Tax=Dendroctonus ponderosae TaxID=77166 RepID=A0AAR5Q370_DENPD